MHDEPLDTTHADTADLDIEGDSSDVVTGPIGNARLVDPATAESLGADLEQLPVVKPDEPAD